MCKKKKIILAAAVIISVGVVSISAYMLQRGKGKSSRDTDTSPGVISYNYLMEAYSDKGIVTVGDDGLMYFTDAVSKETTVICDKANCEHEPYDENTNPDPVCNGYMLGLSATGSNILMVENGLYFWGRKEDDKGEMQDIEIYRADLNGDHKKKVATVPGSTEYVFQTAASDGRYLVIGYQVSYEENDSGELVEMDRPEGGVIILDLRDYSVIDDRAENMGVPLQISIDNQRIYMTGIYMDSDYSRSALTALSDEELTQYFEQHEYTGIYIYNLELHRGAQHELLDDMGEQRLELSDFLLNGDMVVFQQDADTLLYHERTHSYETIYSDEDGYWAEKMYKPVCWKGSEIYFCKYDNDTEESAWLIYDTKDGSQRDMGTTKDKIVCYGLGDYLFGVDWRTGTGSAFVLTEEEFFGTGADSEAASVPEPQPTSFTDLESDHKVVWASMAMDGVSAESQERINQILQEEGCNYQVEFQTVRYEKPSETKDIAEDIQKLYPAADIMQVADVGDADTANLSMIRGGYFRPLQSWLDSDAGKPLWDALPTEKWETVSVDGEIYTVPNTGLVDQGIYFVLNPKYVTQDMVKEFDGTMQGVEKLVASLGKEQPGSPVLLGGISGVSLANSAGGRYFGGLFWQEEGSISAWYRAEPVRTLYESLHRLYQQGALSENVSLSAEETSAYATERDEAIQNQDFVVYIGSGNEKLSEYDWADCTIVYADRLIVSNINCSTGISAVSDNPEEAEDFLLRAYTDQRIANLMIYDEELPEKLEKDGKILYNEERYGEMLVNGLAYGNTMAATPMRQEDMDSRAAAWSERMGKCGKKSVYLGMLPDLTGWEDAAETLVTLLEENADVWKEEDFDQAYASLITKSKGSRVEEYVKEMEKQRKEQIGK